MFMVRSRHLWGPFLCPQQSTLLAPKVTPSQMGGWVHSASSPAPTPHSLQCQLKILKAISLELNSSCPESSTLGTKDHYLSWSKISLHREPGTRKKSTPKMQWEANSSIAGGDVLAHRGQPGCQKGHPAPRSWEVRVSGPQKKSPSPFPEDTN